MNIFDIMDSLAEQGGSDIHLIPGVPPVLRLDGELKPVPGAPILGAQELSVLIDPLMNDWQKAKFEEKKEWDFAFQHGDKGRF